MRTQISRDIRISTHRLLLNEPIQLAMKWQTLTPSLKRPIVTLELWLGMDPPKLVVPTVLALSGVHFDLIESVECQRSVVQIHSSLTARLAGYSMNGRFISDAPNT